MNNTLLLGGILVVIGLALALLAYAILLMRKEEPEGEAGARPAAGPAQPPDVAPESEARAPAPEPAAEPAPAPAPAPARPTAPPVRVGRIHVAMVLRDEVTGDLILQVGEREYRSVEDLRDSPHWDRIRRVAADLTAWFHPPPTPAGKVSVSEPSPAEIAEPRPRRPTSVVEQIDAIVARKLVEAGMTTKAVRLVEAMDGTVKVYIGIQSYSVEEVPDPDVKRIIREAVAEWESTQ